MKEIKEAVESLRTTNCTGTVVSTHALQTLRGLMARPTKVKSYHLYYKQELPENKLGRASSLGALGELFVDLWLDDAIAPKDMIVVEEESE